MAGSEAGSEGGRLDLGFNISRMRALGKAWRTDAHEYRSINGRCGLPRRRLRRHARIGAHRRDANRYPLKRFSRTAFRWTFHCPRFATGYRLLR